MALAYGSASGMSHLKESAFELGLEAVKHRFASFAQKTSELADELCVELCAQYNVDENSVINEDRDEIRKIYKEWFATEWRRVEKDFQVFYQTEIRPKADADSPVYQNKDDIDFRAFYTSRVRQLFTSLACMRKEYQAELYLTCAVDDGIQNPDKGNIKIRREMAREFLASLDLLTDELSQFVWIKVNKVINWIRCVNYFFKIPIMKSNTKNISIFTLKPQKLQFIISVKISFFHFCLLLLIDPTKLFLFVGKHKW